MKTETALETLKEPKHSSHKLNAAKPNISDTIFLKSFQNIFRFFSLYFQKNSKKASKIWEYIFEISSKIRNRIWKYNLQEMLDTQGRFWNYIFEKPKCFWKYIEAKFEVYLKIYYKTAKNILRPPRKYIPGNLKLSHKLSENVRPDKRKRNTT